MRYTLQLEMLERHDALPELEATDLLRREFMLALNAGCFIALSGGDIGLDVVRRSTPQEGVTGYTVRLDLEERASMGDEHAQRLVRRAFANALNGSYFLRVCTDDLMTVRLVSRTAAYVAAQLKAA